MKKEKRREGLIKKIIITILISIIALIIASILGIFEPSPPIPQELLGLIDKGELGTLSYTTSSTIWCDGADINRDGVVDDADVAILNSSMGNEDCSEDDNWCNHADINKDGVVDSADTSILADHWLEEDCDKGFCDDGTPCGECSTLNPPLYCEGSGDYGGSDDGIGGSGCYLVFDLSKCGADAGKCCQSNKNPAQEATYLALNLPESASCSNSHTYFTAAGFWKDTTFTGKGGMAQVAGGYPTRVTCSADAFVVESSSGVRYKNDACIFVPSALSGSTQQVAIYDWSYKSYAYCNYGGGKCYSRRS